MGLIAEDPGWGLSKQGVLEPFTTVVAKEMGFGQYCTRYKEIFESPTPHEHHLFKSLQGYIKRIRDKEKPKIKNAAVGHSSTSGPIKIKPKQDVVEKEK